MMVPSSSDHPSSGTTAASRRAQQRARQRRRIHVPSHMVTNWNTPPRYLALAIFGICLFSCSLLPILLIETGTATFDTTTDTTTVSGRASPMSVHRLIDVASTVRQQVRKAASRLRRHSNSTTSSGNSSSAFGKLVSSMRQKISSSSKNEDIKSNKKKVIKSPKDITIEDLRPGDDGDAIARLPVARGWSGRPFAPAVVGARRGHIPNDHHCPINVDSVVYWNDPVGTADLQYKSPFAVKRANKHDKKTYYISFAPDQGGWNNVRMSLEIILVIAAATGRTVILPPKEPLYLLNKDKAKGHVRQRGFGDFFPLERMQKVVPTISFQEFLQTEGLDRHSELAAPSTNLTRLKTTAEKCEFRKKSDIYCQPVFDYLSGVGHNPTWSAQRTCLIFDENAYVGKEVSPAAKAYLNSVCGEKRSQTFVTSEVNDKHRLIHFRANEKRYRLLTHFYAMIHFTDPLHDHHYKRMVRDYIHYKDEIWCAAGIIVKAIQAEAVQRKRSGGGGSSSNFAVDQNGAGAYSSLHVRRGDLQYKKVKIPSQEWYDNTKELWQSNELLYVATDERNKTFFQDLAEHCELRFLDDYWSLANLSGLDPNYMGMIDTVVAARGRAFAGTWFSTFTGYINRLRGYYGMSMSNSWYGYLPRKTAVHAWPVMNDSRYAYEWPDGWMGIDADTWPGHDVF